MSYKLVANWFVRNLANIITAVGIKFCFVLAWVVIYHPERTDLILGLLLLIYATDYLDGKAANRFGKSDLGGMLDRIRDKLAVFAVVAFLIRDGRVHISFKIVSIPVAVIEAALIYYMIKEWKKKVGTDTVKVANGRGPGQIKMFIQSAALFLCVANVVVEPRMGHAYHVWATIILNILFAVAIFYAVKSYISHRDRCNKKMSAPRQA